MKLLRIIIDITIVAFIINCTATSQIKESKLVLKSILKGSYDLYKGDIFYYFLVDIKLCNNADSTCNFVAYSCETNLNLLTDSKQVIICSNECGGNFPRLISVKPRQTFSIPIIIKINRYSDIFNSPVKVGLVLFYSKNLQEINDILQKKEKYEYVLWSDSFILNNAGGQPYEIY